MTKNFKAVIETLSEVGYYLAFCFLVVTKTVKIPFKKLASAAEANIKGIGIWLEHAEREAYLARNQSTPLEELIQNLESEILRVTYFCLDPRIREVFKKTDIAKITELIEANGSNMDDLDALRPVKGVFETYVPCFISRMRRSALTFLLLLQSGPAASTSMGVFRASLHSKPRKKQGLLLKQTVWKNRSYPSSKWTSVGSHWTEVFQHDG